MKNAAHALRGKCADDDCDKQGIFVWDNRKYCKEHHLMRYRSEVEGHIARMS